MGRSQRKKRLPTQTIILAWTICVVLMNVPSAMADIGEDFSSLRIDPGDYYFVPLVLSQGEGLYTRFRITYGEGIYFFIVDQDGHDDIMGGNPAQKGYEEVVYYAEEGRWYYVSFIALHDSTWYVWFSKVTGAPLAGSSATIEGHVRKDTDGPTVLEAAIPEGPLSGIIEVHFRVIDQGYPISSVSLQANGTTVVTIEDPEQTHYTMGFEAMGVLHWDTTQQPNGNYTLSVLVYDDLGHMGISATEHRSVRNGFWDYTESWIIIGTLAMLAVLIACYCRKRD